MTESQPETEVELLKERSRLHTEYEKYSSTEPITDKPSPTFDEVGAGELQERIKINREKLSRLRSEK